MKLSRIFKGTKKVLMPGEPGFDPFNWEHLKAAYESLPPDQRAVKVETARHLDRIQKSADSSLNAHVEFGPRPGNYAWGVRNSKERSYQSQIQDQESPEARYWRAMDEWLAGGSIGPRPRPEDFHANLQAAQKTESLGKRLNRWASELMSGV